MFPLDALDAWPRLYGRPGFVQYQLVVPPAQDRTLHAVIECLARAHVPCFLAILKDFGAANGAPLSFPIQGWTLALDLPRAAPGLGTALSRCDELVAEAGGRVYLTKDARMDPETVRAMYPRFSEWREVRDRIDPDGVALDSRRASGDRDHRAPAPPGSPRRRDADRADEQQVLLVGGSSEIGLAIVRRIGRRRTSAPVPGRP